MLKLLRNTLFWILVIPLDIINYHHVHGGTISLSITTLTQSAARSECESGGATHRLADIESAEEESKLLDNYKCPVYATSMSWIGMELVPGGSWYWHEDSRLATWFSWNPTQPNADGYCARYYSASSDVYDTSCTTTTPSYMCEADVDDPCDPNPCQNGGTCCVIDFTAICNCAAEWPDCYSILVFTGFFIKDEMVNYKFTLPLVKTTTRSLVKCVYYCKENSECSYLNYLSENINGVTNCHYAMPTGGEIVSSYPSGVENWIVFKKQYM